MAPIPRKSVMPIPMEGGGDGPRAKEVCEAVPEEAPVKPIPWRGRADGPHAEGTSDDFSKKDPVMIFPERNL